MTSLPCPLSCPTRSSTGLPRAMAPGGSTLVTGGVSQSPWRLGQGQREPLVVHFFFLERGRYLEVYYDNFFKGLGYS